MVDKEDLLLNLTLQDPQLRLLLSQPREDHLMSIIILLLRKLTRRDSLTTKISNRMNSVETIMGYSLKRMMETQSSTLIQFKLNQNNK